MDGSMRELSHYRMEHAKEMLIASEENLKVKQYKTSLNRSYYAVFHAMRAVNILEGFDPSKHSGVIAYFNRSFLKSQKIDKRLSVIIKEASLLREKSDYDDFYIASKGEAEIQHRKCQDICRCCGEIYQWRKKIRNSVYTSTSRFV